MAGGNLIVEGVVINQFQAQAKLPLTTIQGLRDQGFNVLQPYLSSSIVMRESHAQHRPLAYLRPKHKLAEEFAQLAQSMGSGFLG